MNALDVLDAAEAAPQGNARLEVLKNGDSPLLRELLYAALSPDITFGVKKLPEDPVWYIDPMHYDVWKHEFSILCQALAERQTTGERAQSDISCFLGGCNPQQRKWSERILKQDLRINVGAKDVNKAFGEEVISLFSLPLATDFNKIKSLDKHISVGFWELQYKLDGARTVAVMPAKGGKVKLLSRTGKVWHNFESVRRVLQDFNTYREGKDTIYLDGEVVSIVDDKINFQALQKTLKRKDGEEIGDLRYIVFDGCREDEWKNPTATYNRRYGFVSGFIDCALAEKVTVIRSETLAKPTSEELEKHCKEFVLMGYEGAMLRRSDVPVENKRGKNLLKVKLFKDMEAHVVGLVEGTGKYERQLGAIACKTLGGVHFEIGTGFNDDDRAEIWAMKELPKFVNLKYQELTNDGVPRFPVFRSFRHEDDVDA